MIKRILRGLTAVAVVGAGTLFQAVPAEAAAQFQLHFRCSPWLYMAEVTNSMRDTWKANRGTSIPMNIAAVNTRLCRQNAERLTFATNQVFASNGIPATFTFTTEVLPGGGAVAAAIRYRVDLFSTGDDDDAVDLMNERTPMPDMQVRHTDVVRDVDRSTCDPFAPPTADCGSLVAHICPAASAPPQTLCKNAAGGSIFGKASPFITSFDVRSMSDTLSWGASTSAKSVRRINVLLRYLPGFRNGDRVEGQVRGLYDRTSTVRLIDTALAVAPLPNTAYLPTMGLVTMAAGPMSVFNVSVLPHEIGHVFGALHERESMVGQPFYTLAGLANTGYQFANVNVYSGTGPVLRSFDTIMASGFSADARLSFSTPIEFKLLRDNAPPCPPGIRCSGGATCKPGVSCPGPQMTFNIGNTVTDNRRYVFETIQWITGDTTLALSAPINPGLNKPGTAIKP